MCHWKAGTGEQTCDGLKVFLLLTQPFLKCNGHVREIKMQNHRAWRLRVCYLSVLCSLSLALSLLLSPTQKMLGGIKSPAL